jgi:hypothetical protein
VKGWIVLPLGLSEASLQQLRAEAYALQPEAPSAHGNGRPPLVNAAGGPGCNALLDHPALVGCLGELLAEPPFAGGADLYHPFRCASQG